MHLFYLIDSLAAGGAERSLAGLAPEYLKREMKVDIAHLHSRPALEIEFDRSGINMFSLDGSRNRLEWIRQTTHLLKHRRPDVIHTTLFESDLVGRIAGSLSGVPVVSSLVNVAYGPENLSDPRMKKPKVRAAQMLDAVTARRVVRFHAVTRHVSDVMSRRLRIPQTRIDVIPRGRSPASLGTRTVERGREARIELEVDIEAPLVLAAARHEHQKGLDVLLEAFHIVLEKVPQAQLVIAGREGNQTPELHAIASRLGIAKAVRFLGVRNDVPELLSAANVFVAPSRWEGLGGVLLEAMALEAPIVATDLPATREIVSDELDALLVRPDHPESIARAVQRVLLNPQDTAGRVECARTRFLNHYTISRVTDEMIAFYGRALS